MAEHDELTGLRARNDELQALNEQLGRALARAGAGTPERATTPVAHRVGAASARRIGELEADLEAARQQAAALHHEVGELWTRLRDEIARGERLLAERDEANAALRDARRLTGRRSVKVAVRTADAAAKLRDRGR